jgi:hypothetical protein
MHRAFVFRRRGGLGVVAHLRRFRRGTPFRRGACFRRLQRHIFDVDRLIRGNDCFLRGAVGHVGRIRRSIECIGGLASRTLPRRTRDRIGGSSGEGLLPPPLGGNPRLLVFVVRVARGAACLLHLVFDHRDDRVVRNPSFARTVIVHDVTEPKPALLHELPRSLSFQACQRWDVGIDVCRF